MYHFKIVDPHFLPHCRSEVEFSLKKGEGLVIVGDNGLGKTTLMQKLWMQYVETKVLIEQSSLDIFYDHKLSKIKASLVEHPGVERSAFEDAWTAFGFSDKEDRQLSFLSGGESQLLKLVCNLSIPAQVYFVDEPTQYLDGEKKRRLRELFVKKRREGAGLIIVEHDLEWLGQDWRVLKLALTDRTLREEKSWTT